MEMLLAHLVGDYVIQNHWMANKKTENFWVAVLHATLYTLPFLLITQSSRALFWIWLTHLIIDHFRLAKYWCSFWGVGQEGWVIGSWMRIRGFVLDDEKVWWERRKGHSKRALDPAPPFLAVWLLILVDNTAHLTLNFLALRFL